MPWKHVEVICRAEGRADQRPLRFHWQAEWLEVEAVEREWLERGADPAAPVHRLFAVTTRLGAFELRVREPGWLWQCRWIPVASDSCL